MRTKKIGVLSGFIVLCLMLGVGGCEGDAGPRGADGADGLDGEKGEDGTDGTDGEDGTDGMDGVDGVDGVDGIDGVDGDDGDAGVDGVDGDDGDNGDDGNDGAPGASGIIDRTKLTGTFVVYPLDEIQASEISGEVRFAEFVDGATHGTLITIRVSGTNVPDTLRVAHVHYNDVATGGAPAITLNKVDGFTSDGTAMSETLVTHIDATATNPLDLAETFVSGVAITYQDLVGTGTPGTGFNGYVNVHKVAGDNASVVGTQVSAGDIGKNF